MIGIAATVLLLTQVASDVPGVAAGRTEEVENLITVIGEKAKAWKGRVRSQGGELICETRKSTGDNEIDAIRCGAMVSCMAAIAKNYDEVLASDLKRKEKKAQADALIQTTIPCMEDYYDREYARLAEARLSA